MAQFLSYELEAGREDIVPGWGNFSPLKHLGALCADDVDLSLAICVPISGSVHETSVLSDH